MQKGFVPILVLIGIVVMVVVAGGAYFLGKQTTPKTSPFIQPTTVLQPSPTPDASSAPTGAGETANWKTYTNTKYGYSIKYPSDYFINNNLSQNIKNSRFSQLIFEISSSEKFDTDQFALVISNYISDKSLSQTAISKYPEYNDYRNNWLDSQLLTNKLPAQTASDFTGNPPYGIYEVSIPLKTQPNQYLKISARIHNQDEKQDLKIFNQILSTFKFIN